MMTKNELKTNFTNLVARIDELIANYNSYLKMRLIDPEKVNIQRLTGLKKAILKRHLLVVESLPEVEPDRLGSDASVEEQDRIMDIKINYRQLRQFYKELDKAVNDDAKEIIKLNNELNSPAIAHPTERATTATSHAVPELPRTGDMLFLEIQSQYNVLIADLDQQSHARPKIPAGYENDGAIRAGLNNLVLNQSALGRAIDSAKQLTQAGTTKEEKLENYQTALSLLELHQKQHEQYTNAINERIVQLNTAKNDYHNKEISKNELITNIRLALESPAFKQAEQFAKTNDSTDVSAFQALVGKINETMRATESKIYLPANARRRDNKKTDMEIELHQAAKKCQEDVDSLTFQFSMLNEKIAATQAHIDEHVRNINLSIEEQATKFTLDLATISSELRKNNLGVGETLRTLEKKFNEVLLEKNEHTVDPIAFATNKLEKLTEIQGQLNDAIIKQNTRIKQHLFDQIELIEGVIQTNTSRRLANPVLKKANLVEKERQLVEEIEVRSKPLERKNSETIQQLVKRLQNLNEQWDELALLLEPLDAILDIHQQAKQFTGSNLVELINKSSKGVQVLSVIGREYPQQKYLHYIDQHLIHFNANGLQAVTEYMKSVKDDNPIKQSIDDKLVFIALLKEKQMNPAEFINNANAINATLTLNNVGLNNLLTTKLLHNNDFCGALAALKELEIPLDSEQINQLAADQNKCALIMKQVEFQRNAQQERGGERIYPQPMNDGVFKSMIEDLISSPVDEIRAINALYEELLPEKHYPGIILLAKESSVFKKLLIENKQSQDLILPFIQPLLESTRQFGIIAFDEYYPKNPSLKGMALNTIQRRLTDQGAHLDALLNAVGNPKCELDKMAPVMKVLNELRADNQDHDMMNAVNNFRKESMGVLLTDKPITEKQEELVELANTHFQQPNVLNRILETIFTVFLAVAPEVFKDYESVFFTAEKVNARASITQSFKEALHEVKHPDGDDMEEVQVNYQAK